MIQRGDMLATSPDRIVAEPRILNELLGSISVIGKPLQHLLRERDQLAFLLPLKTVDCILDFQILRNQVFV